MCRWVWVLSGIYTGNLLVLDGTDDRFITQQYPGDVNLCLNCEYIIVVI